jgi:sugar O-acyltransferase (sialic acid O-acetyltransferase NeuD family)
VIDGYSVVGRFEDWSRFDQEVSFAALLHKAEAMPARIARIESMSIPQTRWFSVIDPLAAVARSVSYGTAFFAGAGVQVLPSTTIGRHVALRSGAVIGHDCVLEDFVFVGANAFVAGYSRLRRGAYVAPGALVRENVTVGSMATVGLGAVVLHDVPDGATVVGNPARIIRHMTDARD